jgi:hypothetical protein
MEEYFINGLIITADGLYPAEIPGDYCGSLLGKL